MKDNVKRILTFFFLYVGIMLISNAIILIPNHFLGDDNGYRYLLLPFPVKKEFYAFLTDEMLAELRQENPLIYYPLGILTNILVFITTFYLFISRKIHTNKLMIFLILLDLSIISFYTIIIKP